MRLDKFLSDCKILSRRECAKAVKYGRISINGIRALSADQKVDETYDAVALDGRDISYNRHIYIMLNKPKGYVTTMKDEKGRKNVSELVKGCGVRVYPVGRLDMFSEGLLMMTNDGDFANRMMHPSHNVSKTYHTWVQGRDIGPAMECLRLPMELDGYLTHPAEVELVELIPGVVEDVKNLFAKPEQDGGSSKLM